jgi:hypothetical protein
MIEGTQLSLADLLLFELNIAGTDRWQISWDSLMGWAKGA